MKGKSRYGWKHGMLSQETAREQLLNYDREKVEPSERKVFGAEDGLRPQLINICRSKNVLIEGITVRNSPFWCIHPLLTENLVVRKVRVISAGPNSDGCDPESCRNVLIDSCYFETGDDCIALKSGRNNDGRRVNRPCENIYVRGCQMKDGHGGIVIGSEAAGGCHKVWVENCHMDSPNLDRVVRIKTNSCRGNVIEDIYVRNTTVGKCFEAILKINLVYEPNENCDQLYPPVVQHVYLDNIESNKSKYGVYVDGNTEHPENVNNIYVENCRFNGVEKGDKVSAAQGVKFLNVFEDGIEASSPEE